jgi:L,D-transpeptidase YcbB
MPSLIRIAATPLLLLAVATSLPAAVEPARGNAHTIDTAIASLEAARAGMPLWFADGRPRPQALALLDELRDAEARGLDPAAGEAARLADALVSLDAAQLPALDRALSRHALAMAITLHRGRIVPRQIGIELEVDKPLALADVLQTLAEADRPAAVFDRLEPPYPGVRRLRGALAAYRRHAAEWDAFVPEPWPGRVLEPGQAYAGTAALAARLAMFGDLDADAVVAYSGADARYDGALVAAVETFQRRHGLAADGRIGVATRDALSVPMTARITQIRLAMERWRWAPIDLPQPPIVVNVPEFRLRAVGRDGGLAFESDVVVGRSFQRQTPLFAGRLDRVVFQPSWHVPASIVRRDLLPRVKANAAYLAANNYVITGSATQQVTPDVLEGLRSGRYGLRQTPGPHNALGAVKFLFPNDHSVYLHGTAAPALFDRARRDFSSGCVRVRDVAGLAEWVLRGNPAWPRERIDAALAGGAGDLAVAVSPPIPVFLVYVTAVAAPDGRVYFFDDIYGHDARLQ